MEEEVAKTRRKMESLESHENLQMQNQVLRKDLEESMMRYSHPEYLANLVLNERLLTEPEFLNESCGKKTVQPIMNRNQNRLKDEG